MDYSKIMRFSQVWKNSRSVSFQPFGIFILTLTVFTASGLEDSIDLLEKILKEHVNVDNQLSCFSFQSLKVQDFYQENGAGNPNDNPLFLVLTFNTSESNTVNMEILKLLEEEYKKELSSNYKSVADYINAEVKIPFSTVNRIWLRACEQFFSKYYYTTGEEVYSVVKTSVDELRPGKNQLKHHDLGKDVYGSVKTTLEETLGSVLYNDNKTIYGEVKTNVEDTHNQVRSRSILVTDERVEEPSNQVNSTSNRTKTDFKYHPKATVVIEDVVRIKNNKQKLSTKTQATDESVHGTVKTSVEETSDQLNFSKLNRPAIVVTRDVVGVKTRSRN